MSASSLGNISVELNLPPRPPPRARAHSVCLHFDQLFGHQRVVFSATCVTLPPPPAPAQLQPYLSSLRYTDMH
jgi:hypothetical protein